MPDRPPQAGVRNKIATVALIVALVLPPTLAFAPRYTKGAAEIRSATLPFAAPPEPFIMHRATGSYSKLTSIFGFASSVFSGVAIPSRPEGLGAARVPTVSERIAAPLASLLGLMKPAANNLEATSAPSPPQPSSVVDFDFDNDGKADIGRWHTANTEFKVRNSNGGSFSTFTVGSSSSIASPGDFNGDGKTDAAVFSAGTWKYKTSTGGSEQTISWGTTNDIPVAGDYDGDGTTDAAIYRPSTNTWWVSKSTGGYTSTAHGAANDIPVPGDYDGDGKNDLAVYRPSNGYWYIVGSTAGSYTFNWGIAIDTPVPADYDGDGKTDPAVFRPTTGTWYAYRSYLNNGSYYTQAWGNYADQPVPGDYDGDSKADFAIWRPTTGSWYILKTSDSNFEIHTLGVPGDTAVPSAYLKQVGGEVSGDAIAAARLAPRNATGGTNPYSQNFSWGTSLVGLPGRSGLDAGFGISYNSLVWTKVGSAMVFDADHSNASPGFRFGFPIIEPIYYDTEGSKNVWAYMMVTPSGARVQFRQTTVSNTYETADSSYTQLVTSGANNPNDPVENVTIKVTTTDGTQMSYIWSMGAYRCTQIKDRNGNYITLANDSEGRLSTMTDTLGRVVTVNYDSTTGYPSTITQIWKTDNGSGSNTTHTWATLTYANKSVDTNFDSSITVIAGPPDDTVVKVLDKITYPDGSSTKFDYNGYLQVTKVTSVAADSTSHELNYVSTNLASPSSGQTDCPRFTETRSWAENFNLNASNVAQEVVITNSAPTSATYSLPDSISGSASRIDVALIGHPDGLYSRTYVGSSGWKEGLTLATEECTGTNCSDRKRWTWADWTQDTTGATYITNPRVMETRVGDPSNTKRTKLYYYEPSTGSFPYGLPEKVEIYDSNLSTVLKTQTTTYNLSTSYTNRRIVGLASETKLFDGTSSSGTLMSKMTYAYDEGNFSDSGLGQDISPTQHDTTYDSSFITGRGNLTSTTRWNVDYPTSSTYAVTNSMKYNTAGGLVSRTDPMSRTVKIGYSDVWNDSVSRTTYAYPTVITDPAGSSLGDSTHSSTVKYRYDIGANVEAIDPTPTGESYGKKSKRAYDSVGRLERDSIYLNSSEYSYVRYEYPTNGIQSKVYATMIDTDADGADTDDEVLSETWADGAGRVRLARTPHTFSSGATATWAGTRTEYDMLGRVKRQSVPTEVDSSWDAAGDDASRGYLWTSQEYDWKNRVIRKINTDGNPSSSNDSDVLISYDGCGCAGGQITTIEGENIIETDWEGNNPTPLGRRKQKIYEDILGRQIKTETFEWNGSTVYSATTHTYNARDQITTTRQYAGSTSSSTYRDVTMTYDGHGRMATRHYPIEDTGASTSWTYNADDSIATVTDPRGVVTTFSYYSATGLLNQIAYTVPSGQASTVDDTPDVTFAYDNLGNRTSMSDGTGSVSYVYNEFSRLESETRTITGVTGSFPINYTYTLSGAVKTFTDPQNSNNVATYGFDKLGRTVSLQRASEGSIHDTTFRAWGAIKEYRTSANQSSDYSYDRFSYDNRLNVSRYQLGSNTGGDGEAHDYHRYADGAVKYIAAEYGPTSDNPTFDRLYRYDSVGRLIQGKSGYEVNGRTDWGSETPYRNNMSYNAFGEVDSVSGQHWGRNVTAPGYTIASATGRVSTSGYDAAGNVNLELIDAVPNPDINRTMKYDAAGRNVYIHDPIVHTCCENDHQYDTTFDGNGWRLKKIDTSTPPGQSSFTDTEYEFRSTVLGGEVVGSLSMASWHSNQGKGWVTPINGVSWGDNPEKTAPEGIKTLGVNGDGVEFDTRGADVGLENPYNTGDGGTGYPGTGGDPTQAHRCASGGLPEPCDMQARIDIAFARIEGLIQRDSDKRRKEREKKKPVLRYSAYALRKIGSAAESSTNKPGSGGENPGSVDSSSVPDATGINEEDGCDFTKDGPNCHVQSLPWNFDDVDAAQTLKNIFDAARKALKAPKKDETGISCSELFAGKGLEFLDAYEKSIGKNGALRFGKETADGGKFATDEYAQTSRQKTVKVGNEKYSVIAFNSTSSLFSSETFGFTGKSSKDFGHLTFVEFWAAALLHEIGHSIRNKFGDDPQKGGLIDPDAGDPSRSRANQVFVAETCFPKQ